MFKIERFEKIDDELANKTRNLNSMTLEIKKLSVEINNLVKQNENLKNSFLKKISRLEEKVKNSKKLNLN